MTSKTDPNTKDSDEDGINDYNEIALGLNPSVPDSNGDGTKDGDSALTYNYSKDNIKLTITGIGNVASTIAKIDENTKISNKQGLIDRWRRFIIK